MEDKKRITYIISDIDKALAFEWVAEFLNPDQFNLSFVLLKKGESYLEGFLKQKGFEVYRITCAGKKDWGRAVYETYRYLKKIRPDAVHCHLIQANIIGLTAAKLAGVSKRIYTRHHADLHHTYFPKGVWWDKFSNRLATHVVAISSVVREVLISWEKIPAHKVVLIPHGFLLEEFGQVSSERTAAFKERHDLHGRGPVVGVISRFIESKGVQYIIPAFSSYLQKYPGAVMIMLNPKGDYEQELLGLLRDLPSSSYRLIPFERDIAATYSAMDLFIHVPVDKYAEAFGQTFVEALASGVPSVFTWSGIAVDFIKDRQNAVVVPFRDSESIFKALDLLTGNKELYRQLSSNGRKDVQHLFSLSAMMVQLEDLYANK